MSASDEVIGTVHTGTGATDGAQLFLVVRGDRAGFVLEVGGADFFEIDGDGSEVEAIEQAMRRAEEGLRKRVAGGRAEPGPGDRAFPC